MLAVLSCNMQCKRDNENAEKDQFEASDMKNMALFRNDMIKAEEYGHFFCTAPQFTECYKQLVKEVDEE